MKEVTVSMIGDNRDIAMVLRLWLDAYEVFQGHKMEIGSL